MTTTSARRTPTADAAYRRAHEQVMRFLDLYYTDLCGAGFLTDLDEFVTATVNPHFRRMMRKRNAREKKRRDIEARQVARAEVIVNRVPTLIHNGRRAR